MNRDQPQQRLSIDTASTPKYILQALEEVEWQRDAALQMVEQLTEQLMVKEAEIAALTKHNPSVSRTPTTKKARITSHGDSPSWCRGNWLCCGGALAEAESAFHAGDSGSAIQLLDEVLKNPKIADAGV